MSNYNKKFDNSSVTYEDFETTLRPRELECLCLRCEGKSLKEISSELGISEFVVRNYMTSIFNKIGIRVPVTLCQMLMISIERTRHNKRGVVKANVPSDSVFEFEEENKHYISMKARQTS